MPIDAEPPELSAPLPDPGEALATDAAGAELTGAHGHHGPFHTHCENCGTKLDGPWCHKCGQHDFEFHRSFRHVFMEALESFFHFEGKFFRNIVTLLFSPGRLTAEFNAGKRAAQMPPFRLYVFVSFLFFFLFFLGNKADEGVVLDDAAPARAKAGKTDTPASFSSVLDEVKKDVAGNPALQQLVDQAQPAAEKIRSKVPGQNAVATPPAPKGDSYNPPFAEWLNEQGERAVEPGHRKELADAFIHSAPKMLLFCLPFFALFTRVLFRKSGQVYLQHLVLALHFHTFIYLWLLFRDGWSFLAGLTPLGLKGWVRSFCDLWLMLYPFLMLRRLFANSWRKTIVKTGLLAFAYLCTLGCAFAITLIIIFAIL